MVRTSLWLLLAVLGACLAQNPRDAVAGQEEDRVIRVEWKKPYTDKADLVAVTVEERDREIVQPKQWKKAKWSKPEKKYSAGEKYSGAERTKRSLFLAPHLGPVVAPLVAPPLVAPWRWPLAVAEAVEEARRATGDQLSQIVDAQERAGLEYRQAAIDGLVQLQDGRWVGELAAQEAARLGQQAGEIQQEAARAVGDRAAQAADAQLNARLDQAQLALDAKAAAENSEWVGRLAAETEQQRAQLQGEVADEAARVATEQAAQVKDVAERQGLDAADRVEDGKWVGQLAQETAQREVQRQGEVADEASRQVSEVQAQAQDLAERQGLALAATVEDTKWVGQLANEAVQADVLARQLHGVHPAAVVLPHLIHKRETREKRSHNWVAQLQHDRVHQAQVESARQAGEAVRLAGEAARQVGEAHRQATEAVNRRVDAANVHVQSTQWVGPWLHDKATQQSLRVAEAQAEAVRRAGEVHRGLAGHHLWKRSNWVAELQHDRLHQAQVEAARRGGEAVRLAGEAARQVGEAHRQATEVFNRGVDAANVHVQSKQWVGPWLHDKATQHSLRVAEAQAEAVRQVGEAHRQATEAVNRRVDATNVHVQSTQWVGPWLHDKATQHSLRVAEAQAEAARRAGEVHRGLAGHHLWKRSDWVAQLQHDRVHQAQVESARQAGEAVRVAGEAARQVGEAHRQAAEAVNRRVDAANVHVQSTQWVGPWLHDKATQQSLRVAEAQAEAVRRAGEVHRGLAGHHLWKRSDWVAQLQHDRVHQAQVESARQAGEAVRLAGEAARQVGEAHRQATEAVNRRVDAANVHVQSTQWVGPWLHDKATQQSLRVAEAQAEAVRRAGEVHRGLAGHHLWKRSNWVAELQHDRLHQAQVEAARQGGEAVRLAGEAARQVAEAHRQATEAVNRRVDAANVHVQSTQWVAPWLQDKATQHSLRVAEAQAEAARQAAEVQRRLTLHHLKKRALRQKRSWMALLQHDRLHQAQVEAARQVGELNRQAVDAATQQGLRLAEAQVEAVRQVGEANRHAADVLDRRADAVRVAVESNRWVGPWLQDKVTQNALRVAEAQAEAARRAGEVHSGLAGHHLWKRSAGHQWWNWGAQLQHDNLHLAQVEAARQAGESVRRAGEAHRQAADAATRQVDAANVQLVSKQWVGPWLHDKAAQQSLRAGEAHAEAVRRAGEVGRQTADALRRQADAVRVNVESKQWVGPWLQDAAALQAQRAAEAQAEAVRRAGEVGRHAADVLARQADAARVHVESKQWVGPWLRDAAALQAQRAAEAQAEAVRRAGEVGRQLADLHHRHKRSHWVAQLVNENGERALQSHIENQQEVVRAITDQQAQLQDTLERGGLALEARIEDGRWVGHFVKEAADRELQRRGEIVQEVGRQLDESRAQVEDVLQRRGLAVEAAVEDTRWVGQLAREAAATAGVEYAGLAHGLQGHLLAKRNAVWPAQLQKENAETAVKEYARVAKDNYDLARDAVQRSGLALQGHLRDGHWVGQLVQEAANREVQRQGEVVEEVGRRVGEVNGRLKDQVERAGLTLQDKIRDTQWVGQLANEIGARQRQAVVEVAQEVTRATNEALAHRHKRSYWTPPLQAARDTVQESVNTHRWVSQLAGENLATGLQNLRDFTIDHAQRVSDNVHSHPLLWH